MRDLVRTCDLTNYKTYQTLHCVVEKHVFLFTKSGEIDHKKYNLNSRLCDCIRPPTINETKSS